MKPISISERMMFNTVRLVASDRSSGTGYFYNFVRLNLSRGFSAKYNVFENRVQNIRRADSPQRLRIIGSKVFFYL